MVAQQEASERAVEDVLAKYLTIAEEILNCPPDSLKLLERQQSIPDGRIDLLYSAGDELILVELKITRASESHISQIERYKEYYESTVIGDRYPSGYNLTPVLLTPDIPKKIEIECDSRGVSAIEYSIEEVFSSYEAQYLSSVEAFELKPVATSVDSIHLINGLVRYLGNASGPKTVEDCVEDRTEIAKQSGWNRPRNRMGQLVRLAVRLNLIYLAGKRKPFSGARNLRVTSSDELLLTERGISYLDEMNTDGPKVPNLTVEQAEIITELLYERPFYSKVTVGLVVLLDTIFDLARATERVTTDDLVEWFPKKAGKQWNERSSRDLVRWYGNYLDELGLVSKVKDGHYLTPEGINLLSYLYIEIGKEMIRSE